MEPNITATTNEKINIIRDLMDNTIDRYKNLRYRDQINTSLKENYEATKEAILGLMLRNVSGHYLSNIIEEIISSFDDETTSLLGIFNRMKKLNTDMTAIKNRGFASASNIINFVECFTDILNESYGNARNLEIVILNPNDTQPIARLNNQPYEIDLNERNFRINLAEMDIFSWRDVKKEVKKININEQMDIIRDNINRILNVTSARYFKIDSKTHVFNIMEYVKKRYTIVEDSFLNLLSNTLNNNMSSDNILKQLSDIFYREINNAEHLHIQDIELRMTLLNNILEEVIKKQQIETKDLQRIIQNFVSNTREVPLIVFKNLKDCTVPVFVVPSEKAIENIRSLMDEIVDKYKDLRDRRGKKNKLLKEDYEATKEAILELMLRNVSPYYLNCLVEKIVFFQDQIECQNTILIFNIMNTLNKHMTKIKNKGFASASDISEFVECFSDKIGYVSTDEIGYVSTDDLYIQNIKMRILNPNDKEPIATLISEPNKKYVIAEFMNELMLNSFTNTENKECQEMKEAYMQTRYAILAVACRNFDDNDLDCLIKILPDLIQTNTLSSNASIKNLNELFSDMISTKHAYQDDLLHILHIIQNDVQKKRDIESMADKLSNKPDQEPITTLINQPQNTTETNKNFQQINK